MATVTKTWTFDADMEGWAFQTAVWTGADGDPDAGCVELTTGALADDSVTIYPTWADWGVPAGASVTGAAIAARYRAVSVDAGGEAYVQALLASGDEVRTFAYHESGILTEAGAGWEPLPMVESYPVTGSDQPSSATVSLFVRLSGRLSIMRLDTLALTITYTEGAPPPPAAAKPHPRRTVVPAENRRTVVPGTDVLEDAGRRTEVTE